MMYLIMTMMIIYMLFRFDVFAIFKDMKQTTMTGHVNHAHANLSGLFSSIPVQTKDEVESGWREKYKAKGDKFCKDLCPKVVPNNGDEVCCVNGIYKGFRTGPDSGKPEIWCHCQWKKLTYSRGIAPGTVTHDSWMIDPDWA